MVERPLIGAGADSYAQAASEVGGGETLFAHNLPLEIWAEFGPIGLALVIVLFASTGTRIAPALRPKGWTWHLAGAAAVWAAALGALLALAAKRREAHLENAPSA
jgi:O-antigen ligase